MLTAMVFGWKLVRVKGGSMRPTLRDGDIVLARRGRYGEGDVVVCRHTRLGRIVKRVDESGRLAGDDPNSTAAAELGLATDTEVLGVARWAITPFGVRRLSARSSRRGAA